MSKDLKNYPCHNSSIIDDIKQIINVGRQNAYTAINAAMISTYWNIGRRIVEEEQHGKERVEYGKELIKMLAVELTHEFGNGFLAQRYMALKMSYIRLWHCYKLLGMRC